MILRLQLSALLLILLLGNWMPGLDARAEAYIRATTLDSLGVFAAAKGLNAAISVAQSLEVGVGVSVSPFEFLDPVNDLVERFSGFILYGLAALGLQKVLLVASGVLWLQVIFAVLTIAVLVMLWLPRGVPVLLLKLVLMLAIVRFALIAQVGVSWSLDQLYFLHEQDRAVTVLEGASDQILNARERYLEARESGSWWEGVKSSLSFDVPDDQRSDVGQETTTAIVDLIVIMLLRSILLPLLALWLLVRGLRLVYDASFSRVQRSGST